MLAKALDGVISQVTASEFSYEVVVVDNDRRRLAEDTALRFQSTNELKIIYDCEPEQNIALARNRAIQSATGNFIAFMDDDEFPDEEWLLNLYKTYDIFNADGVLGPVKPHFETDPPQWIIKSKLCERSSFETGTILKNSRYTRTGNVLLSRDVFHGQESPFDPHFGLSGGEDTDFFKRKIEKGFVFVWCNEACVYETIPPERQTRTYFVNRAFLRGMTTVEHVSFISFDTIKSIIAVLLYTPALPFLYIAGQHLFIKYLTKDCDHLGKLLAYCGLKVVKKRLEQ